MGMDDGLVSTGPRNGAGIIEHDDLAKRAQDMIKLRGLLRSSADSKFDFFEQVEAAERALAEQVNESLQLGIKVSRGIVDLIAAERLTTRQSKKGEAFSIASSWFYVISSQLATPFGQIALDREQAMAELGRKCTVSAHPSYTAALIDDFLRQSAMTATLVEDDRPTNDLGHPIWKAFVGRTTHHLKTIDLADDRRTELNGDPAKEVVKAFYQFADSLGDPMTRVKLDYKAALDQREWVVEKSIELGILDPETRVWPDEAGIDTAFQQLAAALVEERVNQVAPEDALAFVASAGLERGIAKSDDISTRASGMQTS